MLILLQNGITVAILRLIMAIRRRILQPFQGSFFLLGPRGTGKTLWTKSVFPDARVVDLLDPAVFLQYSARPERLRELVAGSPGVTTIVIDEVQKIPRILEVVHQLISEQCPARFVLTGSSARKLRRGDVNLLGGRAAKIHFHPYMACELGEDFRLEQALEAGMVPIVVESATPSATLRAYTSLYIHEEVFSEALVRNTDQFARFLETLSFSHGEVLTVTNIARDSGVSRKTVESYLSIIEDLMLGYRIPIFSHHAKRHLAQHPKFYLFDVGVFRALRPTGPLDDKSAIQGHALEGLVAQHLRAWCDYAADGRKLYFWRTRSNVEVDFVVYGPTTFEAIEVKNSATVRPQDLRALKSFLEEYPNAMARLLYRGSERLLRDGIIIEPIEAWLKGLT
jgi:predicted AAA+ superfamily ATPase